MTPVTKLSVAEFHRLAGPEEVRYELDEGELIAVTRPFRRHNRIAERILLRLARAAESSGGEALGPDNLFALGDETFLAPDASFLRAERAAQLDPDTHIPGAPDLAVEVLSPNDSMSAVDRKVRQYLDAGCRVVWVVDPEVREVMVYRAGSNLIERRREEDSLTEQALLPDFAVTVGSLFS